MVASGATPILPTIKYPSIKNSSACSPMHITPRLPEDCNLNFFTYVIYSPFVGEKKKTFTSRGHWFSPIPVSRTFSCFDPGNSYRKQGNYPFKIPGHKIVEGPLMVLG